MDFTAEESLIDEFVAAKGTPACDGLIVRVIREHFLPQQRYEEAQGWRAALTDDVAKSQIGAEIRDGLAQHPGAPLLRLPKNDDWLAVDGSIPAQSSSDQQYHYDRTLKVSYLLKTMLKDIDDVRICSHEWVTFTARDIFGALGKLGASMETIAAAMADYIDYLLLTGKVATQELVAQGDKPEKATASQASVLVRDALGARQDILTIISDSCPEFLDAEYLGFVNGYLKADGVKKEEVFVTDRGILILKEGLSGKAKAIQQIIPGNQVLNLELGTDTHTEHTGYVSKTTEYLILTINTVDYQRYSRWLHLGRDESEINQNRSFYMRNLEWISRFYDIVQGDSWTSSSGFRTTFGVIW